MKILHYSLGFPPYRTGGLTKYCMDLMLTQKEEGHHLALMWPGRMTFFNKQVRIHKTNRKDEILSYEVINPMPVPLDEGITDVEAYTGKCPNPDAYLQVLEDFKPDVIHVHTLMGMYSEFIELAKKKDIRIIYTSHDYFGICPKVTLFKNNKTCDGECVGCPECNRNALSLRKIHILQSTLYRNLKDSRVVMKLRRRHRAAFFESTGCEIKPEQGEKIVENSEGTDKYNKLRNYYVNMLNSMSIIHFNSTVTEGVYRKYISKDVPGKVINIAHKNIHDNRKQKAFGEYLRITYLAPPKPFKGYGILRRALDELWKEGQKNFELNIYNEIPDVKPYVKVHQPFEQKELPDIMENTDVLVAPSVWYETYGFTVLEALSFGVPVMVSSNVGAKDLLEDGKFGMIISPDYESVKHAVGSLLVDPNRLKAYNEKILRDLDLNRVINSHVQVEKLYTE